MRHLDKEGQESVAHTGLGLRAEIWAGERVGLETASRGEGTEQEEGAVQWFSSLPVHQNHPGELFRSQMAWVAPQTYKMRILGMGSRHQCFFRTLQIDRVAAKVDKYLADRKKSRKSFIKGDKGGRRSSGGSRRRIP